MSTLRLLGDKLEDIKGYVNKGESLRVIDTVVECQMLVDKLRQDVSIGSRSPLRPEIVAVFREHENKPMRIQVVEFFLKEKGIEPKYNTVASHLHNNPIYKKVGNGTYQLIKG